MATTDGDGEICEVHSENMEQINQSGDPAANTDLAEENCDELLAPQSSTSNPDKLPVQEEQEDKREGFLFKRSRFLHMWDKTYFILEGDQLRYHKDPKATSGWQMLALPGASLAECEISGKQQVFRLQPKGSSRAHYIHAESESDLTAWMQAIVMARGRSGDKSESCVLQ